MEFVSLSCPHCDHPLEKDAKQCPQCHQPVVLTIGNSSSLTAPQINKMAGAYKKALTTNPDNEQANSQIGMCYVALKLYDKALPFLEKAIDDNVDNPDTYCMAAICLLRGKKPFVATRPDINKMVDYLNAANMLEPRGIYYHLLGYIKEDYFERKFLNVSPTSAEEYAMAEQLGVGDDEMATLKSMLNL